MIVAAVVVIINYKNFHDIDFIPVLEYLLHLFITDNYIFRIFHAISENFLIYSGFPILWKPNKTLILGGGDDNILHLPLKCSWADPGA